MKDLPEIISNYEALSNSERELVPKTAYNMAKQFMDRGGIPQPSTSAPSGDTSSKN